MFTPSLSSKLINGQVLFLVFKVRVQKLFFQLGFPDTAISVSGIMGNDRAESSHLDIVYSINSSPTSQMSLFSVAALHCDTQQAGFFFCSIPQYNSFSPHCRSLLLRPGDFCMDWTHPPYPPPSRLPPPLHFKHPIYFFHEMDLVDWIIFTVGSLTVRLEWNELPNQFQMGTTSEPFPQRSRDWFCYWKWNVECFCLFLFYFIFFYF